MISFDDVGGGGGGKVSSGVKLGGDGTKLGGVAGTVWMTGGG